MSYLWDRSGADPEVEKLEASLGELAYKRGLDPLPEREPERSRWRLWLGLGAVAVTAAALLAFALRPTGAVGGAVAGVLECSGGAGGWTLEATGGAPRCNNVPLPDGARLLPGRWLETDADSRARLEVADIGELAVAPGTRLAIRRTGPDEHRLLLDRGEIAARVKAPPRLFVVDTPNGTAVDLGCAYTMRVGDDGAIHIAVTDGEVSFERGGRAALLPAGYQLWVDPSGAVSLPIAAGASPERVAMSRDPARTAELIAAASAADSLALWHLLDTEHCAAAHARLIEIAPFGGDLMARYGCDDPEALRTGWREVLRSMW